MKFICQAFVLDEDGEDLSVTKILDAETPENARETLLMQFNNAYAEARAKASAAGLLVSIEEEELLKQIMFPREITIAPYVQTADYRLG